MNNLNEKHLHRLIHPAILDRFRPVSTKDDVYTSSLSCQEQTLPFFLFWPKRLFLRTFNECGRKNQSKSIHKCFTVIVSNGPIDSSIVRQLDSPTLLHKNWQKVKITYVVWITLYSIYISMFPLLIWKKIKEI